MSLYAAATLAAGRLLPSSEEIPFDDKGYTTENWLLPPWKELVPGSIASIIVFTLLIFVGLLALLVLAVPIMTPLLLSAATSAVLILVATWESISLRHSSRGKAAVHH